MQKSNQVSEFTLFPVPTDMLEEVELDLSHTVQYSVCCSILSKADRRLSKARNAFPLSGHPNLRQALQEDPVSYHAICGACIELTYSFLRQQANDEFRCFSLSAALVYLLHKVLPWKSLDYEDYSSIKQRANRIIGILDFIDQNFQRKLLLGEIAQRENLSLSYLSHLFKDTLGMSFQEYLNHKRFEYACGLLFTTDRTILDISISSGFSDARYFNDTFAAQYGCTPKEYRKGRKLPSSEFQQLENNTQYFFTTQDALLLLDSLHQRLQSEWENYNLAGFYR